MKQSRVIATGAVVATAVAVVLFLPLPFSVQSTFEVQPRNAEHVFAAVPGQLQEVYVGPGDHVKAGQPLMKLDNPDLRLELLMLEGRVKEAQQSVDNLVRLRFDDPTAADQVETAEEILKSARRQYEEKKEEVDRLTIVAPVDGTVIPPPSRDDSKAGGEGRLPTWTGTPFDKKNLGALFAPTDLMCQIGNPTDMEAVLFVDQAYIDLVHEGQPVRVLLDARTHRAFKSEIEEIAGIEVKNVSANLSAQQGGRLETKTDPSGMIKPLNTSYQARAPLGDAAGRLQVGLQGQARIYTGWQPLGRRIYRYVTKTFHFDL